jgi:hypothetical protein
MEKSELSAGSPLFLYFLLPLAQNRSDSRRLFQRLLYRERRTAFCLTEAGQEVRQPKAVGTGRACGDFF